MQTKWSAILDDALCSVIMSATSLPSFITESVSRGRKVICCGKSQDSRVKRREDDLLLLLHKKLLSCTLWHDYAASMIRGTSPKKEARFLFSSAP